jgi:hypothetical protein
MICTALKQMVKLRRKKYTERVAHASEEMCTGLWSECLKIKDLQDCGQGNRK